MPGAKPTTSAKPARPKDRLLPAISMRDDAGQVTYVSVGWIALAYNIFGICYVLGANYGEAYIYLGGIVLTLLALLPLWWRRPRYLLLGFALYLVFEDALLGPYYKHVVIAKAAPDAVIFALLAWRILVNLRYRRIFLSGIELPLIALLIISALSTLHNHTPLSVAGQGVYTLLRYAAVFMLAAQCRFTKDDLRVLIRFLTFVAMVEAAIGLLQYVLLRTIDFQLFGYFFVQGTTSYFNILGAFLAIACVLALVTYTTGIVPRPRAELSLLLGLSAVTMTLALSRQSLGMLAIGWIVAGIFGRRKTPLVGLIEPLASTIGGVVIASALIYAGSQSYQQQTGRIGQAPIVPRSAQVALSGMHTVHSPLPAHDFGALLPALLVDRTSHAGPLVTPMAATASPTPSVVPSPTANPTATPTSSSGSSGTKGASGSSSAANKPKPTKSSRIYNTTLNGKLKQFGANFFSTDFYVNARTYEIVNGGSAVLKRSPLLGLGPGTFGGQSTFHNYEFYNRLNVGLLLSDPRHNYVADVEWMNVFGQLGLLGLLAFLWMFAVIYRIFIRTWRMQRSDTVLARTALAGAALVPMFLFAGFTGPNFEVRTVAIWLWLLGGLVVAVGQQGRVIQLNRPLLPQVKRPASEELFILAGERALPDASSSSTPIGNALQAPPRPETWERAITPRWTPNGESGLPPVRSFWDDEPDQPAPQ
jgi:hypothetical protein